MAIVPGTSGSTPMLAGGTSAVVDITAANVGDWVYCWATMGVNSGTISASGWTTLLDADAGTFAHYGLFRRQKQLGDTTFTFSWTNMTKGTFGWVSYSGPDGVTPDENAALASNDSLNRVAIPTPTATPTAANRWALTFYGQRDTTSPNKNITWTPDAALVERLDVNNQAAGSAPWTGIEIADSNGPVAQVAQSYTATASPANEIHDGSAIIFLIPAASGSATWAPSQARRAKPITTRSRPHATPLVADQPTVPQQQQHHARMLPARPRPRMSPLVVAQQALPPQQTHRPRVSFARLRRRTATPVGVQVVTPPVFPPRGVHRQIRGLLARHGHAVAPVPAQIAVTAPVYPPGRVRRAVRLVTQAWRRQSNPFGPLAPVIPLAPGAQTFTSTAAGFASSTASAGFASATSSSTLTSTTSSGKVVSSP